MAGRGGIGRDKAGAALCGCHVRKRRTRRGERLMIDAAILACKKGVERGAWRGVAWRDAERRRKDRSIFQQMKCVSFTGD